MGFKSEGWGALIRGRVRTKGQFAQNQLGLRGPQQAGRTWGLATSKKALLDENSLSFN